MAPHVQSSRLQTLNIITKINSSVTLRQVTVPGQVVDVACGVDHMVALVKSLL